MLVTYVCFSALWVVTLHSMAPNVLIPSMLFCS